MNSNDGIYKINLPDEIHGHDNLAHTIPELSETQFNISALSASQQQPNQNLHPQGTTNTTDNSNSNSNCIMTPLPERCRMGRKTALGTDFLIIIILLIWLLLIELGIFPHFKNGFFCKDTIIDFKFQGDTIPMALLMSTIFVPFFLIWITEATFYKSRSLKETRFKGSLIKSSIWYREFFIGMLLKIFVVECLKVVVGELRPHFLDTCKPDAATNCTPGTYIVDYKCTGVKSYMLSDASKSFPSGHSSIAAFEAVFMVWYFQNRCPKFKSTFLMPLIQTLCFVWACACALTRITDRRHHWWDVLAGFSLGVLFACLTCALLCKNFKTYDQSVMSHQNNHQNGGNSVRRLLSNASVKDEYTLNHVSNT